MISAPAVSRRWPRLHEWWHASRRTLTVPTAASTFQEFGLYLLLFLLPFSKAAIEILFPLLLIGWVVEQVSTGWSRSAWRHRAGQWCLAALISYLAVCALSVFTSTHWALSLRGLIRKTLEYLLLFVVATDIAVRNPRIVTRGFAVLAVSAFLVGLDAVAQEILRFDPVLHHLLLMYGRMTGPYENPGDLATYLIVLIPIVLVQMIATPAKSRWLMCPVALLLLGCLLRTNSLGADAAAICGVILFVALRRRWSRWLLTGVLVAGVLVAGRVVIRHAAVLPQMIHTLESAPDIGVRDRIVVWEATWRMIQDRPILGHGLNTFMASYLTYWVGGEQQPRYAHNCFLQVAAETGVLGLITFIWLLGAMGVVWVRAICAARVDQERMWLLALVAGLGAFVAQSVVDTNFYALRQAALFWTLAGIATGFALDVLHRARSVAP